MHYLSLALVLLSLLFLALGHDNHAQEPWEADATRRNEWTENYGPQIDHSFSGPLAFSHLPYHRCLDNDGTRFDIAVLGMPFDTGVSYRPGARFGPYGIRSGSRRQRDTRGWTLSWQINPYALGSRIIDCGDVCGRSPSLPSGCSLRSKQVPVNPYDNALAMSQMEVAYSTLLNRPVINDNGKSVSFTRKLAKDGFEHPRIVTYVKHS